jgi:hypothetical protein
VDGAAPPSEVLVHDHEQVFGHVIVPRPARAMARARGHVGDPDLSAMLTPEGARAMLQLLGGLPPEAARAIDLEQPIACVLTDFKIHARPYVCSFAYRGGAEAFATHVGGDRRLADAQGHFARIAQDPETLYVDRSGPKGERVVISYEAGMFGIAGEYLQEMVVARAGELRGDVEIVLYPHDVHTKYRDRIETIVDESLRESEADPGSTETVVEDPAWSEATAAWRRHNRASAKALVSRIAGIEQLSVHLGFDDDAMRVGLSTLRSRQSPSARNPIFAGLPVERRWLEEAPANSFVVAMFHLDHRALAGPPTADLRRALAGMLAGMTTLQRSELEVLVERSLLASDEAYTGGYLVALRADEHSAISGVVVREKSEKSVSAGIQAGRTDWMAWSESFDPGSALGPEASRALTWRFESLEPRGEGPPVDRWILEAAPALEQRLAKRSKRGGDSSLLRAVIDGRLQIDRIEKQAHVIYEIAWLDDSRRAVEDGGEPTDGTATAAAMLNAPRVREPGAELAVDLRGLGAWLHGWSEHLPELSAVPSGVGENLGDVRLAIHRNPGGQSWTELSVDRMVMVGLTRPAAPTAPHKPTPSKGTRRSPP